MSAVGSKNGALDWRTNVPYEQQPDDDFVSVKVKASEEDEFEDLGQEFEFSNTSAKSPDLSVTEAQSMVQETTPSPTNTLKELEAQLAVRTELRPASPPKFSSPLAIQSTTQLDRDDKEKDTSSLRIPDKIQALSAGNLSIQTAIPLPDDSMVQLPVIRKEQDLSSLKESAKLPSSGNATSDNETSAAAILQRRPSRNAVTIDVASDDGLSPLSTSSQSPLVPQPMTSQMELIEEKSPRTFRDAICHFFSSICCPFGSKSKKP
jgi:hypothetical protein